MLTEDDLEFYQRLPAFERFEEACDPDRYTPAPESWSVVVTDVKGSTRAVEEGRYKDVNVLGAASIAAALNTCVPRPPFVFGGDGATLLVPPAHREPLAAALEPLAAVARAAFELDLRVGAVTIEELRRDGFEVRVAKVAISPDLSLAMFAGDGIDEATRRVKRDEARTSLLGRGGALERPPLEGLQCRWKPLESRQGEIVTLLVRPRARGGREQAATYRAVLDVVSSAFEQGGMSSITVDATSLATDAALLESETRVQTGEARGLRHGFYRWKTTQITRWANSLMRRGKRAGTFDGATYASAVARNSDFRKFDGMLRMVIDATAEQRRRLEAFLEEHSRAGELDYGITVAPSALMTCLVFDRQNDHVHFVDGGNGGYTMAARQMAERAARAGR